MLLWYIVVLCVGTHSILMQSVWVLVRGMHVIQITTSRSSLQVACRVQLARVVW